ncbi:MAG: ATP-binding protein [Bacteroidales bacterium]|nr:ATP-binding protein [Candidatus Colimorpha onthohippi]
MITTEQKEKIVRGMDEARKTFGGTDGKFAQMLGISASQYSRVKRGEWEQVLADVVWIGIARQLEIELVEGRQWNTAVTPVFTFISTQLERCQKEGLSSLLCDLSDIGKTWTAKRYRKTHKNVAYIDCSLNKSKAQLIRAIAKQFGLDDRGRLRDLEANLCYYLKTLDNPLVILDEAGDLHYEAFLELKALWNATEGCCGWYMMGADGLKAKMQRSIDCKKVGYAELFSRFGKRYGTVVPVADEGKEMMRATALMIIKANGGEDAAKVLRKTMGDDGMPSLRRIYTELRKNQ